MNHDWFSWLVSLCIHIVLKDAANSKTSHKIPYVLMRNVVSFAVNILLFYQVMVPLSASVYQVINHATYIMNMVLYSGFAASRN